ncbi:unnamed protein product [Polarella glacialis]|jgi:hypothetical protein|uniref:Uncharacterized protein n=1 Tax=Polarella glacialis TaxID=89957 RepID=A0A813EG90_POLGL|nr:unnamed protein product [Polarella glacialis]CAE8606807.1 unnamed protein product [Polarella glacialis]
MAIRKPKMRQHPHPRKQFSVIEDPWVAGWVDWMTSTLTAEEADTPLWPHGYPAFYRLWDKTLGEMGLASLHLTPGSLRAGGATHHFLKYQDVPRLRRRGRWRVEGTLEHYVQEGLYALQLLQLQVRGQSIVAELCLVGKRLLNNENLEAPSLNERSSAQRSARR